MNKVIKSTVIITVLFFTGCEHSEIKKLNNNFLKTRLGTIEKQKLITTLPKKKVIKKKKKKENISVKQKKDRFKNILVPIVTEVYNQLQTQYESVKEDISLNRNHEYIESLKEFYKAKNNETLLHALKPHPVSIVLAQGAIESAWLTSRFTKKANNIFGVWSFKKDEPRIAANATRGDKKIYLKKYKNLKAAVYDYYKNLAKNWAYVEFRKQRTITDDPYELVKYLTSYSEKREAYVKTLQRMIDYNEFYKFDVKDNL